MKKTLLATMFAASLGAIAVPASAAVDVYVDIAPPSPRYEVVPAPRRGYTWAPGYWDYRGNRHHWRTGTWVRDRPGYYYQSTQWVERDGRWHMQRGNWSRRDRDGDGVPNRYDSRPNNPNRN